MTTRPPDPSGDEAMTRAGRAATLAVVVALATLTVGVATVARASERSGYDREALQRDLDAVHNAGITGVLGEVRGRRGRLVARAGVADLRSRRPVPYRAYFRMGSSTKTFVATVILQLAGERRLSLDDTVEEWLPGVVAGDGNDGRQITVRQLLQHTSGLYDYLRDRRPTAEEFQRNRFRSYRPEELVAMALRHPPSFAPGTSWEYSNTNYVLAGMIIEKVTGRTWDREVRDRILRPLRLHHTFSPDNSPFVPPPRATAYNQFTPGGPLVDVTTRNESWGDAAGNLITTTADLTRFWVALAQGELLRPAELAEMHETVPAAGFPIAGARYGLGILWLPLSCGGGYWTHGGDTLGYSTRGGVTPDGRRAIAISLSTRVLDLRPSQVADQAVDHALCARR
jgi:D-alanyl-D-alanine carboxypeptidase